jgi:integrase
MAASLRSAPVPPTRTSPTERDRRVPAAHFAPSAASIRAGLAPAAGPASAASLASAAGPAAAAHLAHDAIRPAPASAARVPPDLAPLDRFACPAALDGRQGQNRRSAADLLMPMDDDRGAIQAWLAAPPATSQGAAPRSPHTRRAYHREAERLLLWSVVERGKALSSLDADDCHAYRAFLVDPQPRARWCVQSSPGRQSALWRPFTGPLGAAGQRQAAAALSSLFGFLVEQRYLWTNPWRERPSAAAVSGGKPAPDAAAAGVPNAGLRAKGAAGLALPAAAINDAPVSSASAPAPAGRPGAARALDASRSLSPVLWAHVLDAADALPDGGAHPRLRFALRWLYATGLRLSEAVGARLGDLRREPPEPAHPSQLDLPDHTHTPARPDRAGQPGHLELLDDAAQPDHAGQLDHAARPPRQPGRPSQFSQEGRPSQSVQPVQPNQASQASQANQADQADEAGHANQVDQVDQADQADSVDQPNRLLQSPQLPQLPRSGHPAQPGQPLVQARPDEPGRPGPADLPPVWWLQVAPDAFGRQRRLPLPDSLVGALSDYLRQRGLDQDPLAPGQRDAFVLGQAIERGERARRLPQPGPVDARQGVRASTLARQLKQHFGRCAAARAAAGDVPGARQLAAASAHWLRHTHARHLLANGLPLELAQRHLGHAARSTTAAYLVSERPSTRGDWQAAWDATMAAQRGGAPYPGAPADTSTHDLPDR